VDCQAAVSARWPDREAWTRIGAARAHNDGKSFDIQIETVRPPEALRRAILLV
jgi:hypothetical protein